jgi:hypothetical protein
MAASHRAEGSSIDCMASASVSCRAVEPPGFPIPDTLPGDLVVLPSKITEDGIGQYDSSVVDLVKQLRAEGVAASYLHPAAEREWISEKGFTDEVLSFVLGVASNGAWAGLIHLLRRNHAKSVVKGMVTRCVQAPDGATVWEWFEVEGTGGEVAKAFESMREDPPPPELPV